MKVHEIWQLLLIGLLIWLVGTIYYAFRGQQILETTSTRYWAAFVISPLISAGLCVALLKWFHLPARLWAPAMLLLALPGMIGEAIVLSHMSIFMPKLQVASGGRYGAFLFATYAVVLGIAEIVALQVGPSQ